MTWIVIALIVIAGIYLLIKSGNDKFWKIVNKHPLEAYHFFMSNDCWIVIHKGELDSKPKTEEWTGPFYVIIPTIGRIKVYGKTGCFEREQNEFLRQFDSK